MGFSQSKQSQKPDAELTLQSTVALYNGVKMPRLGFGVWQVDPSICTKTCLDALDVGYRHIDSAQYYRNEAEVGAAVKQTKIKRSDIFVNTKIAEDHGSVEKNYESVMGSVREIGGDDGYVDLFLIHTPRMGPDGIKRLWTALEKLLKEGKTKSIGVSNFNKEHIEGMKGYATVWPPHVNQIELNPWVQEKDTVEYCQHQGTVLQAYSPLAQGEKLSDKTVGEIAKKYSKSPAQILIRYCLQKGWVPLPKTIHKDRMKSNTEIYDFSISAEDMSTLNKLG